MLKLLPREVNAERRGDAWYLASPHALEEPPARLGDLVRRSAARAPTREFLIERRDGSLRRVTWAEALSLAEGIASWIVAKHPPPVTIAALSGNSVDHALLMIASHLAGATFVPVSPAYSLLSKDFAKLRVVFDKVKPSVVYVENVAPFESAIEALGVRSRVIDSDALRMIAKTEASTALRAREEAITSDDVAKILFTSGSTGFPKGVANTHRMLCANQQMIAQCWPFLAEGAPPVLVDWLPWSHTFGGNHDFNMVLFHAGTILVDEGRPSPAALAASLANLRECSPTLYFNVPAGYASLVPALEADDDLAHTFFSRLDVIFYAAAALPPDLWRRLTALAKRHSTRDVFLTTAWGSTETSPLATSAHFPLEAAGNIGLPAPGVTLKILPNGSKLEVRVKGPSVMREYVDEPALTAAAFDDEGFYRMGDAVKFADEGDPSRGLVFDGRIAEDFKLTSGTWVSVTTVRTGIVAAAGGAIADVVVCGHDRESLGILAWATHLGVAEPARIRAAVSAWNAANPASSTRITRVIVLTEPPNIDAGEITDKGYTNQRAVRERRAADVESLYADPAPSHVIVVEGT